MARTDPREREQPRSNLAGGGVGVDLFHLLRARVSARVPFDPDRPVRPVELRAILEALRWSPTPHNMQNFEIVAVDDETLLEQIGALSSRADPDLVRESYALLSFSEEDLAERKVGLLASAVPSEWLDPSTWQGRRPPGPPARPMRALLGDAPLLLLVLYDVTRRAPGSRGDTLGLISLGCVLQSAWLAAEALGIAVQVVSALARQEVAGPLKELLDIPAHLEVAFGLRLGHPLERPTATSRVRREVDEFTHFNGYRSH